MSPAGKQREDRRRARRTCTFLNLSIPNPLNVFNLKCVNSRSVSSSSNPARISSFSASCSPSMTCSRPPSSSPRGGPITSCAFLSSRFFSSSKCRSSVLRLAKASRVPPSETLPPSLSEESLPSSASSVAAGVVEEGRVVEEWGGAVGDEALVDREGSTEGAVRCCGWVDSLILMSVLACSNRQSR